MKQCPAPACEAHDNCEYLDPETKLCAKHYKENLLLVAERLSHAMVSAGIYDERTEAMLERMARFIEDATKQHVYEVIAERNHRPRGAGTPVAEATAATSEGNSDRREF